MLQFYKNITKRFSILSFSLAFFAIIFSSGIAEGQAPTITYSPAAASITRGFGQSDLTVTITFNGSCVGTNVLISLPNTVSYVSGSVARTGGTAGLTIAEGTITDFRTPNFNISGAISTGNSITFTVTRRATCGTAASGKDSVLVTFSGGCTTGTTGRDTSGVLNTYNIVAPSLSINANPAITGAVLNNIYTRSHTITNGGNGATDTVRFFVVYPSGGIVNTNANYSILANSVSFDTVSKSGDTLFYKIFGATIFGGDNLLTSAETVTISEPIQVLKCAINTTYGVRWGRNPATICQTTTGSSIVSMATGVPNFTTNTGTRIGYVDKCTPYDYTLTMTNGGSGNPVAAAMYDLKIVQDQAIGNGLNGMDTTLFSLSNIRIGSTVIPTTRISWVGVGSAAYLSIDLNDLLTTDPDGAGGLSDVDGDGYFDDLLGGGAAFTMTTTKTYKCNLTPCGRDKAHYGNAAIIQYHNMCDRSTYINSTKLNSGIDAIFETGFVGAGYLPANIFGGTPFRMKLRAAFSNNSSSHDNSNTRYRWKIAMPAGLAPSGTPNPRYGLTSVTTSTISGGGSGVDTLLIESPTNILDTFSMNFVYTCGAGGTLSVPYTLQKIDNISTGCTCQGNLICNSVSSTVFCPGPCPAGPTNYIPQVRRADGSLGWTDYTLATRQAATAISNYDLSKALYLDTIQVIATALQNNAANNLHVEITLNKTTSPAGLSKLTPISATTQIYRTGTLVGTYTTSTSIISGSTASVQVVEFDLSAGVTALPGGGLSAGDSIYTIASYVVATNNGLPRNDIQQGGQNIHFNINGTGGRDYCFNPVPEMYLVGTDLINGFNAFSANGCSAVTFGGNTNNIARRFNTAGLLYANEFRPMFYIDSFVAIMPVGYQWNFTHLQPTYGPSFLSLTPNISGNVYSFINPGTWQPMGLTITNTYGASVPFNFSPSCATSALESINFKFYIRDYYYAYAGLPTPSGLAYVLGAGGATPAGQTVNITYPTANKPDITLADQTGTVQGVRVNQSWTMRIANGGLTTAPYNWMAVPTSSSITVTQVTDIATSTVIPSISYAGGNWYQLSTAGVASGGFRDYKIDFTYNDCNLDSIKVLGGWNCASYPTDPTAYVCGKDSLYLRVDPKPSQVQLSVVRQPGGAAGTGSGIAMCDADSALIVVQSSQASDLVNPYITFTPPAGITLGSPIKVEYPLGSGNYQNTTVTSLGGGVFKIDLTSHTGIGVNGILGTVSANPGTYPAGQDRQAKLKIDFTTDCAFTSGGSFDFVSFGKLPCGDDAIGNGVSVSTNALNITGATGGGGAGTSMNFGGATSLTCGSPVTLSGSVTPTSLASQVDDTLIYTLPAGMGYGGSFVPSTNCGSCTINSVAGPSGTTLVKVRIGSVVAASSPIDFSFNVACEGAICGSVNVVGRYKRNVTGLLCGAVSCGTTTAILASATSPAITLNKPSLTLTNVVLLGSTAWVQANYFANNVKVYYNNTAGAQAYAANTDTIEFFCGSSSTPFSKMPLTKNLAIGASDSDTYSIMMPIGSCTLGDVVTARIQTTTAANTPQCLCSPTSFLMAGIGLPIKFLSTNAKVNNCAVTIDWTYNKIANLASFVIERSSNGSDYKTVSTLGSGVKNYIDVTPNAGDWYYRIRAIGNDGQIAYSQTLKVNTSQCVGNTVNVYPNPTSGQLNIVLQGSSANNSYQLIDQLGRIVMSGSLQSNNNNKIDLSTVPQGVYVLKVLTDETVSTQQVQVAK